MPVFMMVVMFIVMTVLPVMLVVVSFVMDIIMVVVFVMMMFVVMLMFVFIIIFVRLIFFKMLTPACACIYSFKIKASCCHNFVNINFSVVSFYNFYSWVQRVYNSANLFKLVFRN